MVDISGPALEKGLARVKKVVPSAEGKLDIKTCDVSKESAVKAVVDYVEPWGGVDVIFNNAGIMHADDAGESWKSRVGEKSMTDM